MPEDPKGDLIGLDDRCGEAVLAFPKVVWSDPGATSYAH
jgi:hypothetical protein